MVLFFVFAGFAFKEVAAFGQISPAALPLSLRILQGHSEVSDGGGQLGIFLFLGLDLLFEGLEFVVVVVVGSADHVVLIRDLALEFADKIVEVVELLVEVCVVLPQSPNLIVLLIFKFLDLAIFVLEGPDDLIVLADDSLLALIHHLQLLLIPLAQLLHFLDFLIPGPVLEISQFLLEGQLVADQDIVKLFVFDA